LFFLCFSQLVFQSVLQFPLNLQFHHQFFFGFIIVVFFGFIIAFFAVLDLISDLFSGRFSPAFWKFIKLDDGWPESVEEQVTQV